MYEIHCCFRNCMFIFFKQKTSYEMRIRDWIQTCALPIFTPHHLAISRNALFEGGIRPHLYCLPVLKRERHRLSLRRAATSGNPKFFLGTDTAPHARNAKESARSEEHTSELQSLMRISYAVFCLKKTTNPQHHTKQTTQKK